MRFFALVISILLVACAPAPAPDAAKAASGKQSFLFPYKSGPDIPIWIYAPAELSPETKVVFVMHGVQRNAEEYRDQWAALAEENRFLLIVPEFSQADFPGAASYNLGGVFNEEGLRTPEESWSYSYIEAIFDEVKARFALDAQRYAIYGHSAGAQFVYRFALYKPEARASAIVPANAGWYQMPDAGIDYPYGLKGAGVDEAALREFLQRPMVVLLGDADTDVNHRSLRHTPEADRQGLHRYDRGLAFLEACEAAAKKLATACNWTLAVAPGVDHNNSEMAPHAVSHLIR